MTYMEIITVIVGGDMDITASTLGTTHGITLLITRGVGDGMTHGITDHIIHGAGAGLAAVGI